MNFFGRLAFSFLLSVIAGKAAAATPPERSYKDPEFTAFFQRTNGWTAGDGALSIPLSDGRVLWVFGDSHIDDLDSRTGTIPCLFQVRNAGLLQDKGAYSARTLIGTGPGFRSWFKNSTNNDTWFWPVCGLQQGRTVYVYLSQLHKTGAGGMWGFEGTGQDYWGKVNFPAMDHVTYAPLPKFNGITFGMGFVESDAYIYAFGAKQNGLAGDLFVARFKSTQPEDHWSFWNGNSWTNEATQAKPIGRGASTSMHVCKIKNKFVLVTSAFSVACDQGKEIYAATSSSPTGPFSERKSLFTVDDTVEGHFPFFYLPAAHPEFINEKNELLVTYCINGYEPCVSACKSGRGIPDHYRPRAIRVPLKLMDSEL
jgi:hypothetical protein